MFDNIRRGLEKKEVKVFLVFLFFSTLIWFISKLSNSFEGNAVFSLEYVNVPENQMLIQASHDKLDIKLKALGFQFLGMSISERNIKIDLSKTEKSTDESFLLKPDFEKQIEKQLPSSMKLIEIMSDTLFFDFQEVISKKVAVKPRIQINLAQNYMLDGALVIRPDSIIIKGPKNQVDTITNVRTPRIDLSALTSDFSQKSTVIFAKELTNTKFSNESVTISGKVSKFSEKKFTLQIEVVNLPNNLVIKTFPEKVDVICLGTLEVLKELNVSDFQVIVDYKELKNNESKKTALSLRKKPAKLYSAILEETEIEYIIKQK